MKKIKTSSEVNSNISRLLVIAESYLETKANEEFQNLNLLLWLNQNGIILQCMIILILIILIHL